jgi:hypothetical protein
MVERISIGAKDCIGAGSRCTLKTTPRPPYCAAGRPMVYRGPAIVARGRIDSRCSNSLASLGGAAVVPKASVEEVGVSVAMLRIPERVHLVHDCDPFCLGRGARSQECRFLVRLSPRSSLLRSRDGGGQHVREPAISLKFRASKGRRRALAAQEPCV